jgi:hypothetical protein
MAAELADLDQMQRDYKAAVDNWVAAIRREETPASVNHTVAQIDQWENAGNDEEVARNRAKERRKPTKTLSARSSSTSDETRFTDRGYLQSLVSDQRSWLY